MHGVEMSPSRENVVAGGIPNAVIRLSNGLRGEQIESILVSNDRKYRETGKKSTNSSLPSAETHLVFIGSRYGTSKYAVDYVIKTVRKIRNIHERTDIDVIHGHSGDLALSFATWLSGKHTGLPTVHTIYCPPRETIPNRFFGRFLKDVNKIIAISNNVRIALKHIGISDRKMEVIPPLIDFSRFAPHVGDNERRALGVDDDEFLILYLGNLTRTKGIDTVLDALSIVKDKHLKVKLLSGIELSHTGTIARANELTKKIETHELENNILELGLMKNVEKVMDVADVVVAPFLDTYSVADYPLTLLESMAVGTPVITSKVGGIREFIRNGENGILVRPNDSQALSEAIISLINNPTERNELGKRAAIYVREEFQEEKIVKMTRHIYEEVASIT